MTTALLTTHLPWKFKATQGFSKWFKPIQTKKGAPTGDETRRSEVRRLGLLILIMILIVILPAPNCYGLSTLNSLALLCTRLHHFAVILKRSAPGYARQVWLWLRPNSTKKIFPFYHPWNQWNPWLIIPAVPRIPAFKPLPCALC